MVVLRVTFGGKWQGIFTAILFRGELEDVRAAATRALGDMEGERAAEAADREAEESLVHDVDVPSQRRFGDLDNLIARRREPAAAREREWQLASDRSPTPEPEHTWVDLDALHTQRMAAPPAGVPATGPRQLPLIHVGMSAPAGP